MSLDERDIATRIANDIIAKSGGKAEYKKFFDGKLKKYNVSSPSELSDDQKKKFYDEIDKGWEADNETD